MVVVFAHFADFGGQISHFKRVELLVEAPWWPSEVLNILRYPNHNYKIASVPKIRFVQFLRHANGTRPRMERIGIVYKKAKDRLKIRIDTRNPYIDTRNTH